MAQLGETNLPVEIVPLSSLAKTFAPKEKHKDDICLFDVAHSGCCSWPQ